ncbi:hypothetical protein SDC9_134063 [bioreactor metagenome]|uniref:Uncharacterized protein n=1 Tax=bioreactor metagenome TaxID=1076179 RepID=A0A645DBW3_9ZZZZ
MFRGYVMKKREIGRHAEIKPCGKLASHEALGAVKPFSNCLGISRDTAKVNLCLFEVAGYVGSVNRDKAVRYSGILDVAQNVV